MSEHEVAKHTKVIYKAWKDPNRSWKHKFSEIAVEVLIIVFAITLSLLVERWREHAHERTVEKQFLLGLKKDLQADITQQSEDSATYAILKDGWAYFYKAGKGYIPVDRDSITTYQWTLLNNTTFFANNSRFEALKSSGELGVIEDDSLQNLILDLYQYKMASLGLSNTMFSNIKNEHLVPYLLDNLRYTNDSTSNLPDLLKQPVMQNYLSFRSSSDEVLERYHDVMQQSRKIIEMIDEQYDLD